MQYKQSAETAWIDRVTNYNGTSVELTGLESNTAYQVQVQSICDDDVLSGWKSTSFETPCASEETFPYHEDFNDLTSNGEIPGCWNNDEGTTTNANHKWCYNSSFGTGHEGKCVSFDSYSNPSGNTNFLKTKTMNFPTGKIMQLSFWYKNPAGGDFSVYISTDGGLTYNTSLATGLNGQADWKAMEITLANYVGSQNMVIVFKGTSNYGSSSANNRLYLDDVVIEEAPTCPKQSALTATTVTSSSVTLDWTAGTNDQDHWDVFITSDPSISPNANTTPTVVNTTQKPYTHSGLNDGTTYFAYVRARCSDTDQSTWSDVCRFTTPQTSVTIDGNHPYSTDFESGCDWMFINGDYANQWCYGTAANNTENGSKAIYISNDKGVTNAYSAVKSVEYATKYFTFAEGVYSFSFDWRAKGNQYYDFIRVALVPASYELVSTENAPFDATSVPTGWIALDGGSKLNNSTTWQTVVADEIAVPAGDYRMVFGWRNFTYNVEGNQPPAAIDNVSISLLSCARPSNLNASNITGRTATLTWTENGTATNWVLEYGTASDFSDATSVDVSDTPSKSLTGLASETKYYARVKATCSSTEESFWSDVKEFTTLATCPKPSLTYVSYSATAYTGTVQWTGNTADAFEVAYRPTNDFDPSDYTLNDVTRITLENVSEYNYTLENLSPETKYYIYLQADCGTEDGKSAWSNRVLFTTSATCVAPSSLTKDAATANTVTLHWTKGTEDQDTWQLRYKKTSDSEYTYLLIDNQSEPSYTLTDLEPVTDYYVNVRAWCSETDQSKWCFANQTYDLTVTTECAAVKLPYACDFEGAVETAGNYASYPVPKCWNRIELQYGSYSPYTYYPYVFSNSSDAHGGTKSLRMYKTPNSANETIILPEIDEAYAMSDLQIRFWAKAGSSNNTLMVGIMENDNFVQVGVAEGISTTYSEFTISLADYTGDGRNIAIKCGASTGYSYLYFNIDDVLIEEVPSCLIPTALTVTATDVNSASFTWAAGKDETEWNFQYKKTSETDWSESIHVTSLPTNEDPFVLTGLQRGKEYEARIQAYCDAEDQSEWSTMPVSFTTECGIWPIDEANALFEDFSESTFPPSCWNWIRIDNYYGWQLSTNVYNPIDPSGTAYSYWPTGDTYLILPQMHIDGNAKLDFDMAFSSSGSGEESSVVLSTTGYAALDFTNTLWTATEFPTTKTNVSLDLSAYNGQDVYIAFKFAGNGTSGRMWYIDNVQVYVGEIFTKEIIGYGEDTGHWYLIASPVDDDDPAEVEGMIANTEDNFDLYRFDQTEELEWRNYKAISFSLESGKGYLYANSEDVTLRFIGTPYNGNGTVSLVKDQDAYFSGWNLVGNPFNDTAYIDRPFYRMNDIGTEINSVSETGGIGSMEGVFVIAETDGEVLTFSTAPQAPQKGAVTLNISQGRGVIDRAIVRFGEGRTLPKFQLNQNSTKVYIPMDHQDYAVVRSEGIGEMPMSFKASENGTYTLSVDVQDVQFQYLYLIDNKTGEKVDLLHQPSYSFNANTSDFTSRFKLMYMTQSDDNNDRKKL